jgi:hypothetical protein
MENHEMNRTDTPTPQPDLSDAALSQLAEAIFEMDIVDAVKAVRSVRDQARAAERKRTLLWAAKQLETTGVLLPIVPGETKHNHVIRFAEAFADKLRRAAENGNATSRKYHSYWCDRNNGGPECNCEFSDEEGGKDA